MNTKRDIYHAFIKPLQKAFGKVTIIGVEVDGRVIGQPIVPWETATTEALRAYYGGPVKKPHRGRQ